jgi:hypothetical protein
LLGFTPPATVDQKPATLRDFVDPRGEVQPVLRHARCEPPDEADHPALEAKRSLHGRKPHATVDDAALIFEADGASGVLGESPQTQTFDEARDVRLSGPEPRGTQIDCASRRIQNFDPTTETRARLEEAKINVGIVKPGC